MQISRIGCASAALAVLAALTGCAPTGDECLPAPLVAELHELDGEFTLELSASGVECDPTTGDEYTVAILAGGRSYSIGTFEPAANGEFREEFPVPAELVGQADALVRLEGSYFDQCTDTGDCETYQVLLPRST